MSEFRRSIAGVRFTVVCDTTLRDQAEGLLDAIGELSSSGSDFQSGQTLNFGGVVLSFRARSQELLLTRPVINGEAILGGEDDISSLLAAIQNQLAVTHKVQVAPTETTISDAMVLERGCLEESKVYMERGEPTAPGDSGWFVGRAEKEGIDPARNLVRGRVWELFVQRPALLSALALPRGYVAVFEDDELVAVLDHENQNRWKRR